MRQQIIPFILAFLWSASLLSQNCGCEQAGNCPYVFDSGVTETVCYSFTDAFNDNLADPTQGICGVRIFFEQDYIWQLELTLTSPSGQSVNLVGENTGCGSGGTNLTVWDVTFVDCADIAVPQAPFSATWDNCQNWPFIGEIGGTYYPHNGCLEDFNTGPVNGEWCLQVNNLSFADGTIYDFEIILCDDTGINCCDAEAGDLDGSITACEGNTLLAFEPELNYVGLPPDSTQYGYVYVISNDNGLILDTTSTPDLTTYPAGNYTVCGLSYLLLEANSIPEPDGVLTIDDLIADLEGLSPSFCGEVSSDCVPISINEIPETVNLVEQICQGDSIMVGDTTFYVSGSYEINILTINDCDSTIVLDLEVLTTDTAFLTETICLGDSLVVRDTAFYNAGNYDIRLENMDACDSLYFLDLTVLAPVFNTVNDTICLGDTYAFGDNNLTIAATYIDTFPSSQMCDSIVTLNLLVVDVSADIAPPENITCNVPEIQLDGTNSTDNASYLWTAISGAISGATNEGTTTVTSAGEYQLIVTIADCSDTATVIVDAFLVAPIADAGSPMELTCAVDEIQLDGTNSESGPFIEYEWMTDDGTIFSDGNSTTPTITEAPATYSIIATNTQTGCADTSDVFVDFDGVLPIVNAGDDSTIDCINSTAILDGSASEIDADYQFQWTDTAGNSYPLIDQTNSETNIDGLYILTVLNTINGCSETDTVEVFVNQDDPLVDAGLPDTLTCFDMELQLNATVQNSTNYTILWTGPPGISDDTILTPMINQVGLYTLTINDLDNGCMMQSVVNIAQDTISPDVEIGAENYVLNCTTTSIVIGDMNNTSQGAQFAYEWYLNNVSVGQDINFEVSESGTLVLVVMNTQTGCENTDTATVEIEAVEPMVNAGLDALIDCENETVTLDGSASEINNDFTYTWTDIDGNIYPLTNQTNSETNTDDTYILTVFNTINNCEATDTIVVIFDQNYPVVDAGLPDTLTCGTTELQLNADVQNSDNYSILWTGPTGISDPELLDPIVNQIGQYVLTINDLDNNCATQDTVQIAEDIDLPSAEAGTPAFTLNCAVPSWTFGDPNDTSQGDEFTYEWFLDNVSVGDGMMTYQATTSGMLVFVVTNTETSCTESDTVNVNTNFTTPVANITNTNTELGCMEPQILLDGEELMGIPDLLLEYEWYNGSELLGLNDDLLVTTAGTYCLVIQNTISFCQDTFCITISENPDLPMADAGDNMTLDCDTGEVTLMGDGSAGNFTYSWTGPTNATIQNETTLMPTVDAIGTYVLEVFDTDNDCSAFAETTVSIDTSACLPIAIIEPGDEIFSNGIDGIIDCLSATETIGGQQVYVDTLTAENSSMGVNISYSWTAISGVVFDETNPLAPIVSAGTYVLEVTNTTVNISVFDTINVIEIINFPIANAGSISGATCAELNAGFVLDGSGSSQGTDFTYEWNTEDGDFGSSNLTALLPMVYAAGVYELTVTDNSNGCQSSAAVLIEQAGLIPEPCFLEEMQMECGDTSLQICDTCSIANYDYNWIVNGGEILGNTIADCALIAVDTALVSAEVIITTTNTDNECVVNDTITVFSPVNCYPECVVAIPDTITCLVESITLDGTGSSEGTGFVYSWEVFNGGNICGDETTLMPCVDEPGSYRLTVTNTLTNFACQSDLIIVEAQNAPPNITISQSENITCANENATLGASSDDTNAHSFVWTAADMTCIVSNPNLPEIEVNCAGIYNLDVTDLTTGCSVTLTTQVDLDTVPNFTVDISPNNGTITCTNSQIGLSGNISPAGNYTFQWFRDNVAINGATNQSLLVNIAGEYCLEATDLLNACSVQNCAIIIEDDDAVFADAGANQFLTCTNNTLTILGDAAMGFEYEYAWTTDDMTCIIGDPNQLEIEVNCAGDYTLTVTDIVNNCSGVSTMTVIDSTAVPMANAGVNMVLDCLETTANLDGSNSEMDANFSYLWTAENGGNITTDIAQPIITVDAAGMYVLTVMNSFSQCFSTDTAFVTSTAVPPVANASVGGELNCQVNQLIVSGLGSEVGSNVSYNWTAENGGNIISNTTELDITVNAAGTYVLTVSNADNFCEAMDTVQVLIDTLPPNSSIFASNNAQLDCVTDTIILNGNNSTPTSNISYAWTTIGGEMIPPFDTPAVAAIATGNYTLTVANLSNACEADTTLIIDQNIEIPNINILPPDMITCVVTSVIIDATNSDANSQYNWASADGFPIQNPTTATPTVMDAGDYMLEITSNSNGCSNMMSITVNENVTPPTAVANALGSLDCIMTETDVSGIGSSIGDEFEYLWEGPNILSDSSQIEPTIGTAGIYTLTVTNTENGCTEVATTEVLTSGAPITDALISLQHPTCIDALAGLISIDSVIGGTPPFLYNFGGQTFTEYNYLNYLPAGNYTINIQDADGCEWTETVTLTTPEELIVDAGIDLEIAFGDSATIKAEINVDPSALDTIIWTPIADSTCIGCLTQVVHPTITTTYQVEVIDTNGCYARDLIRLTIPRGKEPPVYIPTAFSPNNDGENDLLYVYGADQIARIITFRIFDRWGNMVHEAEDFPPNNPIGGWDGKFEGRTLNPAVFVWWLEVERVDGTRDVVKGDVVLLR